MARFRSIKSSFLGGELSPKVDGRVDLPQYLQGCRELKNMVTMPEGGVTRRPGSQLIFYATGADANTATRVVPFVFSESEAYWVLLLEGGIATVYSTSLTDSATSGTLRANQPTIHGIIGTLPSWTETELAEIQYAQSGDVLVLCHPNHPPVVIQRDYIGQGYITYGFSARSWTLYSGSAIEAYYKSFPYLDTNISATTITASATTGANITLTASDYLFSPDHVGALFRIKNGASEGIVKITLVDNTIAGNTTSDGLWTKAKADVLKTLPGVAAYSGWSECAWSDYRGWPRAVTFYDSRLVFGGTTAQPDTIFASQQYDIYEFMQARLADDANVSTTDTDGLLTNNTYKRGIRNDDPFVFTLSGTRVNYIQWLAARESLVCGTAGAEILIGGPNPALSVGIFNISVVPISSYGSSRVQPCLIGDRVIFVGRDGRTVRALGPKESTDNKTAPDLSLLSDHLTRRDGETPSYIIQLEYQDSENLIWALTSEGKLLSCTYEPELGVSAWSHHELGGVLAGAHPNVTSIACLPSESGRHDELYFTGSRTLSGDLVGCIEVIGPQFEYSEVDDALAINEGSPYFVDCAGSIYRAVAATTVTGLTLLADETVSVFADGVYVGEKTISGAGVLTLDAAASHVVWGFGYTSRVIPSRLEAGSQIGSAQGAIKRVNEVVARFYRTSSANYGPTAATATKAIEFRPAGVSADAPIPLYTGDKRINWPGDYDRNPDIVFQTDDPLPMTITALILKGVEYDV